MATPFTVSAGHPGDALDRWDGLRWRTAGMLMSRSSGALGEHLRGEHLRGGLRRQLWRALAAAEATGRLRPGEGLWAQAHVLHATWWTLFTVVEGRLGPWPLRLPDGPVPVRARALAGAMMEALPLLEVHGA